MSTTRVTIAGAALLCAVLGAAHAAPPTGEARRLFDEGKALYQRGSYLPAVRRFHRALELEARAGTHLMAARCYRRLERPELALHHYERHLVLWAVEGRGASPHQEEVALQIRTLKELVAGARRAEAALEEKRWADALALFRAVPLAGWLRVRRGIALSREGLAQAAEARELAARALAELRRWRDAWGGSPPDAKLVQALSEELAALASRLRAAPRSAAAPSATRPAVAPAALADVGADARAPRRRLWLALAVTATALAVGAEAAAWIGYSKATGYYEHEPEYGRYRALSIAGHVVAGTMAAAAVAGFVLYHRAGRAPAPGVAALPLAGGGVVTASLRF